MTPGDVPERHTLRPEFEAMWSDNDVRTYGEDTKHLRHAVAVPIALEYSAFAVDGRPDLGMVIYDPATPADAERIRSLLAPRRSASM
jgi:MmyB-like transcription regulator ligand binding domain